MKKSKLVLIALLLIAGLVIFKKAKTVVATSGATDPSDGDFSV